MEIFKQKPYLLYLLISLALAKIVGVPVIDWQNEKISILQLESKRVAKAEQAVENRQFLEPLLESLKANVSRNRSRVFAFSSENSFKLEQQKLIEGLIEKQSLSVTGIGWLATKQVSEFGLTLYQLQIRFSGDGIKFPVLMAELESQPKWIEIDDFVFAFRRQSATKIGESNGQMTLNFYMSNEVVK
ncbi:hypothetical protein [Shewanella halifaxensis]|uniref:hypothetical protein n=1 Tax=Shewanella halifaxensis TaxID=271098 RepID=UPI000D59B6BE|nr:hypothetical protein [Shewanella halifaxensis]